MKPPSVSSYKSIPYVGLTALVVLLIMIVSACTPKVPSEVTSENMQEALDWALNNQPETVEDLDIISLKFINQIDTDELQSTMGSHIGTWIIVTDITEENYPLGSNADTISKMDETTGATTNIYFDTTLDDIINNGCDSYVGYVLPDGEDSLGCSYYIFGGYAYINLGEVGNSNDSPPELSSSDSTVDDPNILPTDYSSVPMIDLVHFEVFLENRQDYENHWVGFYNGYGHTIQINTSVINDDPDKTENDVSINVAYNGDETFYDTALIRTILKEDADKIANGNAYLMYGYMISPPEYGPSIINCFVVDPENFELYNFNPSMLFTESDGLTNPNDVPNNLDACAVLDIEAGSYETNYAWLESHLGQWVKLVGLYADMRVTDYNYDPAAYCLMYGSDECGPSSYGDFLVTGPDNTILLPLADGLSDTYYVFLDRDSYGSIIGINAFAENMGDLASDPTGY